MKIRGDPQLLQLPLVPSYGLTTSVGNVAIASWVEGGGVCILGATVPLRIHKTQALSIKHRVNGCLEALWWNKLWLARPAPC